MCINDSKEKPSTVTRLMYRWSIYSMNDSKNDFLQREDKLVHGGLQTKY